MSKIAVIGKESVFKPFKALGIEVLAAANPLKARGILEGLFHKKLYSIIFITEDVAEESLDVIDKWNKHSRGTVVLLPGPTVSKGLAKERISNLTKTAIGADVLARK